MESWTVSWTEKGKRHSTTVFNESAVKKVRRNVKKLFGGTNIRVKHFTETYAQIRERERAMGIKQ